jgi:hypothetical protein
MGVRVLDLDGGIIAQQELLAGSRAEIIPLEKWGPRIRLACSFRAFTQFERNLERRLQTSQCDSPALTFVGSGDFHHVTLALLRRLRQPFNLLVLDKHPDWMRRVPLLHCGSWLYHALRLPTLHRVFHVGGDLDFDNWFRWLAPWSDLRSGRIMTVTAVRRFVRGGWRSIPNEPLRVSPGEAVQRTRLDALFGPARADLARRPLYISLDKDVMGVRDAVVNWDSGYLELQEVQAILAWFLRACSGNLIGMDIVGDWSPVRLRGVLRRILHLTEHPRLAVHPAAANTINPATNLTLLQCVRSLLPAARAG